MDFPERDKCKPFLLLLSLAGNLEKPLCPSAVWDRMEGAWLWTLHCKIIRKFHRSPVCGIAAGVPRKSLFTWFSFRSPVRGRESIVHRVHTEWQWPLSDVHSVMMEKLAQAGEGIPPQIKLQCTLHRVHRGTDEIGEVYLPS